jgi:PAS domain S-box-containing protein
MKQYALSLLMLILLLFPSTPLDADNRIKVGVYQNNPLTFIDEDGKIQGFFIDILGHIAQKEGWEIEYVPDSWAQCLKKLEEGKIDLLGVIAYSRQRNIIFDYTYENVYSEWAQVFTFEKEGIESIVDLDEKKVAVLRGDMHYSSLRNLVDRFDIETRFIEAEEYDTVLRLVESGKCDAGVVSRFFGMHYENDYNIHKSPLIFSPQKLYFAAPKGQNRDLLATLDHYLRILKNDKKSIYYRSRDSWMSGGTNGEFPTWFIWITAGIAGLLLLFLTTSVVLKAQVSSKTLELLEKNKELMAEIDQRKRAEATLQLAQFTIEHSAEAAFWMDPEARLTYVNQAACRSLGYTREELLSMAVYDIDPDFPQHDWTEHWKELMQRGSITIESRHRKKDGEIFPVEISINYVKFRDMEYNCAFARNITERKSAEAALLESEGKYRTILDSIEEGYFEVDLRGNFTFFNGSACRIIGYPRSEIMGMNNKQYMDEKNANKVFQVFNHVYATGKPTKGFDWKIIRKNGTLCHVDASVSLVKDGEENRIGFRGMVRDVTEHKRSLAEKKKLEAQLQQAQKMESIGTLAGGIAHDFNNILSAILGYAELSLMDVSDDSQLKDNLNEILKGSNRAKDLVKQILAFSRQNGQEKKPIQIDPIVREVLKMLRASLPTTVEIRQHIVKDVGIVKADPTQIHQVLMNLCTNASHAMSESGGILEVRLANVEVDDPAVTLNSDILPGKFLKLTVNDTGCGMPHDVLERIFDPYFTTKEKGLGTGLGLAVVHGILKSYGGTITVESKPGEGSSFNVFIPRIEKEVTAEPVSSEELPTGSERILFVDDEQALVNLGKQMLEKLGYEAVIRTSSVEALELFKTQPEKFDMVITDMTMPNLTGEKLARELINARPDIPIILCTGYSENITETKAKKIGIKELILKPVVMQDIARTIRRVLDK